MDYKLITKYHCSKCNKEYGQSNLEYLGCQIWIACDCSDKDKVYCLDARQLKLIESFWINLTKGE